MSAPKADRSPNDQSQTAAPIERSRQPARVPARPLRALRRIAGWGAAYVVASAIAVAIVDRISTPELLVEDRRALWRLRPDYRGPSNAEPTGPVATVDASGFRIVPGRAQPADARRILAVGDSFVFGWGVDDASTWPAQLDERLASAAPGKYRVVNAGFPGCSTFQARQRFAEWEREVDPHVVVFLVGRNDGREAALSDREAWSLLRLKPELARYVFPLGLVHYRSLQATAKTLGRRPRPRGSAEEVAENLRWLIRRARDSGRAVHVVAPWGRHRANASRAAELESSPALQLEARLRQIERERGVKLFLPRNDHPNRDGYAVIADEVATAILDGAVRTPASPTRSRRP